MSKMYNNLASSSGTVTEKLGLDSEVRELKFGSSFTSPAGGRGQQQGSFHTIKYDFKPASVDTSKTATLEVGPSGQVTISVPHYDNNSSTVFKGSTRPYTKECVLIIDKETGEIVLEKLSHNVQVKKTRQERPERQETVTKAGGKNGGSSQPQPMDIGPPPPKPSTATSFSSRNSEQFGKERDEGASSSSKRLNSLAPSKSEATRRALSPLPSTSSKHSPKIMSRHSPSPTPFENRQQLVNSAAAFDALMSTKQQQPPAPTSPAFPSLTSIEDLLTAPPPAPLPVPSIPQPPPTKSKPKVAVASQDKDIKKSSPSVPRKDHHAKPAGAPKPPGPPKSGGLSDSSSDDDSSSSSSSDEESSSASDMEEVAVPPMHIPPRAQTRSPMVSVLNSMPNLDDIVMSEGSTNLLTHDLQLSDSGSDSD